MKQNYKLIFTFGASLAAIAAVTTLLSSPAIATPMPDPTESVSPSPDPSASPTESPSPDPSGSPSPSESSTPDPATEYNCCGILYQIQACGDEDPPDGVEHGDDPDGRPLTWEPGFVKDHQGNTTNEFINRKGTKSAKTRDGVLETFKAVVLKPVGTLCSDEWTNGGVTGVDARDTTTYSCTDTDPNDNEGAPYTQIKIFRSEVHTGYVTRGPNSLQACMDLWSGNPQWPDPNPNP